MGSMKKLIPLTFIILSVSIGVQQPFAESAPSDPTAALQKFKKSVKRVRLANGLTLIMVRRDFAPVAAAYIKYRAGGTDETNSTAGIAHMLEHMLFKGTPSIGTTDYATEKKYLELANRWAMRRDDWRARVEEAKRGGDRGAIKEAERMAGMWERRSETMNRLARGFMIPDEDSQIYSLNGQEGYNAYTTKDLTNYQIELPANRLEIWARLESDRMRNSVLRDFYTERDVVTEERRMRIENVTRNLLFEKFLEEIYGDHPYGRSLIGSMESINALNHVQAKRFYETYYAPNNTVIAIVGDIEFDRIESMIRKYFGDMKPKRVPESKPIPVQKREPVRLVLDREGSPFQILAWIKPPFPNPADLELEVLSRILAGNQDSRLFQKLVLREKSAASVDIYTSYPGERNENLFAVMAIPSSGITYDRIEKGILDEIANIRENGVEEAELDRVKRGMEAEFIYALRDNGFLADRISYYETMVGDHSIMFEFPAMLNRIGTREIQEAARRYLDPASLHTARIGR
jgi:predicted Zn-dependent peptidase